MAWWHSLEIGQVVIIVLVVVLVLYFGWGSPIFSGLAINPHPGPEVVQEKAVDLKFQGKTEDLQHLGSYNEAIQLMGLEPSVAKSHARFVNELPHRTTTAGHDSVLTSFNPPVQFHGLPRLALYKQAGASENSRTVPTETDNQAVDFAMHRSSGYTI